MSTGISIISATYGAGSSTVDVSKTVSAHIHEGTLNMLVSVDSLNVTDPSPGQPKVLNVTYTVNNGSANTMSVKDGNTIFIAAPAARSATGLLITKAEYGYEGNYTDVTDAIQDQISNGSINIAISPKSAATLRITAKIIRKYPNADTTLPSNVTPYCLGVLLSIPSAGGADTENFLPSDITSVFDAPLRVYVTFKFFCLEGFGSGIPALFGLIAMFIDPFEI